MLGCLSWPAVVASRRNLAITSARRGASGISPSSTILTATDRRVATSLARQTLPNAPRPSGTSSWYRPASTLAAGTLRRHLSLTGNREQRTRDQPRSHTRRAHRTFRQIYVLPAQHKDAGRHLSPTHIARSADKLPQ